MEGQRIIGVVCQFIVGTFDGNGNLVSKAVEPAWECLWPFGPSLAVRVDERQRQLVLERLKPLGSESSG